MCVVIPAHNEELLIGRCIQSVLDAGVLPQNVYVVDDRSSDRTAQTAGSFVGLGTLSRACFGESVAPPVLYGPSSPRLDTPRADDPGAAA